MDNVYHIRLKLIDKPIYKLTECVTQRVRLLIPSELYRRLHTFVIGIQAILYKLHTI